MRFRLYIAHTCRLQLVHTNGPAKRRVLCIVVIPQPAVSVVSGCMAALEAEHFLQEHAFQQDKAEPTTAENEAFPDNGYALLEHAAY